MDANTEDDKRKQAKEKAKLYLQQKKQQGKFVESYVYLQNKHIKKAIKAREEQDKYENIRAPHQYTEICAICKNDLCSLCIDCGSLGSDKTLCTLISSTCGHIFHWHCKNGGFGRSRQPCPLCNVDWTPIVVKYDANVFKMLQYAKRKKDVFLPGLALGLKLAEQEKLCDLTLYHS
jgi:hypothetical protein